MHDYSYYIDKLINIAKILNITVKNNFKMEVSGRVTYTKNLIELNEPKAKYALMTLAHELGHYQFYLTHKDKDQPSVYIRENAAYLKGYRFLKKIKASVAKHEWQDYHKPDTLNIKETGGWLSELTWKTFKIDDHTWTFNEEDATTEGGFGLPIKGYVFVEVSGFYDFEQRIYIEAHGFYAVVDNNNRIWIEEHNKPGYFESPCLSLCLALIQQHSQSYKKICDLRSSK